jgi:hypothetical protein
MTDRRVHLEQLVSGEAALKRLLDGATGEDRAQAEIVLLVVKAEIEIVKAELASENEA